MSFPMRNSKIFIILISLFGFIPAPVQGDETVQAFMDGVAHYQSGDYKSAVDAFLKVQQTGIRNGKLYYNLGNAYLRDGQLGPAILWYARARRMMPEDPDLKFNYRFALSQTRDEKGYAPKAIYKVLFFWNHIFTAETVRWIAIGLNLLFWCFFAFRKLYRQRGMRFIQTLLLVFVLVFTATAIYNDYRRKYHKEAIVLPHRVAIRSGPAKDATELFSLHAGTRVKIEKETEHHCRIFYSEGKIGWVEKDMMGII